MAVLSFLYLKASRCLVFLCSFKIKSIQRCKSSWLVVVPFCGIYCLHATTGLLFLVSIDLSIPLPPSPYSLLFPPSLPLLFTLSSKVIIRDSCRDREICRASPPHHFQLTRMLHVKLFPLPRRCFPVCGSPATFIYHFLSLVFHPLSFPFFPFLVFIS